MGRHWQVKYRFGLSSVCPVVLVPLATGRCDLPREAAHRPRSNGALLNQAHSRCLPPTRRRSRHRLRRRRPRGPLRIQLTAGDPDAAVRVSAACHLVTSQTALFARAPARTELGRGRRTQSGPTHERPPLASSGLFSPTLLPSRRRRTASHAQPNCALK